jgi:two-component system phosphate regulon sensor histidine kinase PhoR
VQVENVNQSIRNPLETVASIEPLVNMIPGGVAILGPDGSVLYANEDARRLFPASPQLGALVGRSFAGETLSDQRCTIEAGGETVVFEVSGSPIYEVDGALIGGAFLFRDVTARERRVRAERDFVTNAAHELQTPIAAITSAIEVLQRGAKERRPERERFLDHIERACDRLTRLTQALLILARAQTGDEAPRREIVSLEPLLRSIAATSLGDGPIEVSCAPDVAVIANEPLLEQAIVNLGENALKHASGRVVLSAEREEDTVTIHVRDEGPGIDPAETSLVFDRFYRKEQARGFGLGLAIVREAVDVLGGDLELESGPGGTRVSISLPGARLRGR